MLVHTHLEVTALYVHLLWDCLRVNIHLGTKKRRRRQHHVCLVKHVGICTVLGESVKRRIQQGETLSAGESFLFPKMNENSLEMNK